MYQAELKHKIPKSTYELEDLLTSDVFTFFKYSDRKIFLKKYLNDVLKIIISDEEATEAEFHFWNRFDDGTEPDLIIIAGDYYILIEAKYKSGFDVGNEKKKHQLIREIEGGFLEAKSIGKQFVIVALTKDIYLKETYFNVLIPEFRAYLKWTNWQSIAMVLKDILESNISLSLEQQIFTNDLIQVLDDKGLRGYNDVKKSLSKCQKMRSYTTIFMSNENITLSSNFSGYLGLKSAALRNGLNKFVTNMNLFYFK